MKINKGLSIHIIASLIYFLLVIYVFDGHATTLEDRIDIVLVLFLVNLAVIAVSLVYDWYNEELK